LHPGACRTELGRYLFDTSQPPNPLLIGALSLVTRTPKEGAQTQAGLLPRALSFCGGLFL